MKAAVAEATVTTRTIANVEEVVGRTITAIGSIERTLEAVTVHGDRASMFTIRSRGTKHVAISVIGSLQRRSVRPSSIESS